VTAFLEEVRADRTGRRWGVLINRPRQGGRAIYPDQPQKGFPE